MNWSILIVPSAEKEISRLPDYLIQRVREKIVSLKDNPYPPDTKKLKGDKGYRIKAGNYRVVYNTYR